MSAGDAVILAEGLSKKYRIGGPGGHASYRTLRVAFSDAATAPLRWAAAVFGKGPRRVKAEEIWALEHVSFGIRQGEVVGVIGRNGAGKSTLLKILSRITEPTAGRVGLRGRVGSLLEVGTGFHNELTGRENIFLNGAILGMKKAEIERKFDEIVAFSEVERFLDTPVKHYSSGMYMRLAFAVAAHLDPEILLVDEVLAVGDAAFQKKCLGKMRSVAQGGRTVLFVSHNLTAVESLCDTALLFDRGRLVANGPAGAVVSAYVAGDQSVAAHALRFDEDAARRVQFTDAAIEDAADDQGRGVARLQLGYVVREACDDVLLCVEVRNAADVCVLYANDGELQDGRRRQAGRHEAGLTIPKYLLTPGDYTVVFGFWQPGRYADHSPPERLSFTREAAPTNLSAHGIKWPGVVLADCDWRLRR